MHCSQAARPSLDHSCSVNVWQWVSAPDANPASRPHASDAGPDICAAVADKDREIAGARPASQGPEGGQSGPAPAQQGPVSPNWPKLKAWASLRAQVRRLDFIYIVLDGVEQHRPRCPGPAALTRSMKGLSSALQRWSLCSAALHAGKEGGPAFATAWPIQCCVSIAAPYFTATAACWHP